GELRVLDEAALSGLSGAEIHRHVGLAALHGRVLSAVAGHSLVLAALLLGVAHRLVSFSVAGLASRGGSHLLKWAARVSALGNGRFVGTVRVPGSSLDGHLDVHIATGAARLEVLQRHRVLGLEGALEGVDDLILEVLRLPVETSDRRGVEVLAAGQDPQGAPDPLGNLRGAVEDDAAE